MSHKDSDPPSPPRPPAERPPGAIDPPPDPLELRRRAEEQVRAAEAQHPQTLSPEQTRQTLHELQVHQLELEMQNQELRRAQEELDASRARYFDLYDLAPVGYCTLSEQGLILEANLTAAILLGVGRGTLVKQPITRYILPEDQDIYYRHRKQLFETGEPQTCELRMANNGAAPFWAQLQATMSRNSDGAPTCRIVLSDISERKRTEAELAEKSVELRRAFDQIKTLRGIVPICSGCKKIRDDRGYWQQLEVYMRDHTEAEFSHGLCEDCMRTMYPEFSDDNDTQPP